MRTGWRFHQVCTSLLYLNMLHINHIYSLCYYCIISICGSRMVYMHVHVYIGVLLSTAWRPQWNQPLVDPPSLVIYLWLPVTMTVIGFGSKNISRRAAYLPFSRWFPGMFPVDQLEPLAVTNDCKRKSTMFWREPLSTNTNVNSTITINIPGSTTTSWTSYTRNHLPVSISNTQYQQF